ncbi:MAG: exosortase/archaeosortase family protein [Phycisphaerae bacterium]|nr:exosortase/archaeosortase family protein [Gemmatimonadaceae bacterium]
MTRTQAFSLPKGNAAIAAGVTAVLFGILFARPAQSLAEVWWIDPNNGHGLLLAPLSVWLAWKAGKAPKAAPQIGLGLLMLFMAIVARYAADLAAELFVMRCSMILAAGGIVVFIGGMRQLMHWWLPFALVTLSVPIPEVILNSVALPLQFTASKIGAALLQTRDIPIRLSGNVILMAGKMGQPPQQLFVAEACSGLRSLTALISLGVLLGALFLRAWPLRMVLIALTIPVAILINGVRIFITGFLVYFVSPEMGQGFMHTTEGMLMFGLSFLITGMITWAMSKGEDYYYRRKTA